MTYQVKNKWAADLTGQACPGTEPQGRLPWALTAVVGYLSGRGARAVGSDPLALRTQQTGHKLCFTASAFSLLPESLYV